jgi:hypothetical protein
MAQINAQIGGKIIRDASLEFPETFEQASGHLRVCTVICRQGGEPKSLATLSMRVDSPACDS